MKLSPDLLTDSVILLGWFCGLCAVLLIAELIVKTIRFLIPRMSVKQKDLD